MSLSGMFNVGHDVGGFFGPLPEPELFLRWVQACALNPRMVMNSWKAGNVSNLPWMHPEVAEPIKHAIELRYRLMPYLWECMKTSCESHVPIIRPTFFNFPDNEICLEDCDDFMLGNDILVAPVVEQGARQRAVYLPKLSPGQSWIDFETQARYEAGRSHVVEAPLERLPLFVREGAKIALASAPSGAVARHDDPVTEIRDY
jgi:alpha-glucosidase